uniref:Uncharacterized protein n=1 Tax=Avena sativa TaxID=4498 RepID=A0ACD5YNF5_AVESA
MVQHIYAATAMDSSSVWESAPAASAPAAPTMTLATILTMSSIFLMFVIFALVLIFLQYYYNAGVRRTAPSGGGVVAASAGRRDKGVDPELLRSLPVTVYRAAAPSAGEDDVGVECAVCLSQLEDGEEARFLPRCGHGFHAECVDMWLSSHSTCPLCRVTVAKPDDAPLTASSTGLPPVPSEPAHYAANLPASVLLGVSDQATLAAASDGGLRPRPSALATAPALVIEIPEPATPRDASKTPGSARLRSLKRLWSFGRQGPSGSAPSCSWGSGSGRGTADTELRGISSACATPRAPV